MYCFRSLHSPGPGGPTESGGDTGTPAGDGVSYQPGIDYSLPQRRDVYSHMPQHIHSGNAQRPASTQNVYSGYEPNASPISYNSPTQAGIPRISKLPLPPHLHRPHGL